MILTENPRRPTQVPHPKHGAHVTQAARGTEASLNGSGNSDFLAHADTLSSYDRYDIIDQIQYFEVLEFERPGKIVDNVRSIMMSTSDRIWVYYLPYGPPAKKKGQRGAFVSPNAVIEPLLQGPRSQAQA
ncbi:hypothetical protein AX14_001286 [Amanita brunnescens Koide BX004]|nr:hypothetical protein AX14_001286 [Amanita brunnescens Koide BX004]